MTCVAGYRRRATNRRKRWNRDRLLAVQPIGRWWRWQGTKRRRTDDRHVLVRRRFVREQQRAQSLDALRPVFRTHSQAMVDRREEAAGVPTCGDAGQGLELIEHQPTDRGHRRAARDRGIQHGAQRVDVRPRPLFHGRHFRILLDRREARLEDDGQGLGRVADDPPGRAEVEQHRPQVLADQQDVVRCDVAVVAVVGVDRLQRLQQRQQQALEPGFVGGLAPGGEVGLERRPGAERHRHVGRSVLFPEPVDVHQRRMVERGQHLGLVDEAAQSQAEGLAVALGTQRHPMIDASRRQRRRHVFLERDPALQLLVARVVDDPESAFADDVVQFEFMQQGPGWQRVAIGMRPRHGRARRGDEARGPLTAHGAVAVGHVAPREAAVRGRRPFTSRPPAGARRLRAAAGRSRC